MVGIVLFRRDVVGIESGAALREEKLRVTYGGATQLQRQFHLTLLRMPLTRVRRCIHVFSKTPSSVRCSEVTKRQDNFCPALGAKIVLFFPAKTRDIDS